MSSFPNNTNESNLNLTYERSLGAYRPHFEGRPEDYFEVTTFDIVSSIFMVLLFSLFSVGLAGIVGVWTQMGTNNSFAIFCSVIAVLWCAYILVGSYFGSRGKRRIEQKMIQDSLKKYEMNPTTNFKNAETEIRFE